MRQRTVLVTCVDRYMGEAIAKRFTELDYRVITDKQPLLAESQCEELIRSVGSVDILVANLAEPPKSSPVQDIRNEDWRTLFSALVDPLMFLVRAVSPQMLDRKAGKIIAVTSAAPLRGLANNAAYCAARGAQNAFIKAVGLELARSNVHVNAIAQNYINNNTYYPDHLLDDKRFLDHVRRNVPTNQIGSPEETSELAAYLASEKCNHMVGQIIPLAGGWTT
ncbi:SDR family oxidoreductase [Burkholderiales bacterium]|nr:SDR family oxidoreductase [Burkholderiales bacterium]